MLKPSDFLHSDIINYIVVRVAKGMMSLGERVVSYIFFSVKDTTDKLLLEDLFVRNKENGILDINNGKLLRLLQAYSIQNIKDWQQLFFFFS